MKRIAVICADGVGDALVMMIISNHLRSLGHVPVTHSQHLASFGEWFQGFEFKGQPSEYETFDGFDAVIVQHNNLPKARAFRSLREKGKKVYCLLTNYRFKKHGPLDITDYPFDEEKTMVKNVLGALRAFFPEKTPVKDNGIQAPEGLIHMRYPQRVAIHPTSSDPKKNWPQARFLKLIDWLQLRGYDPHLLLRPFERKPWKGFKAPDLPNLAALASVIYESGFFIGNDSGPGHIASLLQIPHLIIGHNPKNMKLWTPDWMKGELLLPPAWVPNLKGLRLKDDYGKMFITTRAVKKRYKLLESQHFKN